MAGKQLKAAPPAETRDWLELPEDALSVIFKKIGGMEVLWPAQGVCRNWRKLALQPRTWRYIDMRRTSREVDMAALTRTAVDRSDGLVEEFHAEGFGNDELLQYIAERTTGLRVLVLNSTCDVSVKGLVEFVRRCPLLEEIQITTVKLEEGTCADIGRAVPNLKRFRLEVMLHFHDFSRDCYALEVADTMTQLKELQLIGFWTSNNGLHTILDKCRNLDSLEISGYLDVTMDDGLKAKLANVKKVTVLPYESIMSYINDLDVGKFLELDFDPDHVGGNDYDLDYEFY